MFYSWTLEVLVTWDTALTVLLSLDTDTPLPPLPPPNLAKEHGMHGVLLLWDNTFRVREAKAAGAKVIDVDGSYVYRKYHQLPGIVLPSPDPPLTGWETVTEANHLEIANKIPRVTHGK